MRPFDTSKPTLLLTASEDERRAALRAGEPVVFPDGDEDARTIRAEWLTDLATSDGTFAMPILIANAVIVGPLEIPYATFKGPVSIVDSRFCSEVDLRGATFERPFILRRSRFDRSVYLAQVDVAYDFRLTGARFCGAFTLRDARVGQLLAAQGAVFEGDASFERLHVAKGAFFTPLLVGGRVMPVRFVCRASFIDARFAFTAEFDGAQFGGDANFSRVSFGTEAFFRRATRALPPERSHTVRLRDDQGLPVVFDSTVTFRDANFAATAVFNDAEFGGKADFVRIHVATDALFLGCVFHAAAVFDGAQAGADMRFDSADARFISLHRMKVDGALLLPYVRAKSLNLSRSRMALLGLTSSVSASIDFRGAHFERFQGDWEQFLWRVHPFTRDAYDSVEQFLRGAAEERAARYVYYERRKREGRELRRETRARFRGGELRRGLRAVPRVLLDAFERFICRYGVRSSPLFAATFLLIFLGALVFARDGALVPKTPSSPPARATVEEAIVYGVALAIPLVQLTPLERWRPSANPIGAAAGYELITFETFSAIYRLGAFLLVPLTFAVVTGLLYRRDRA